VSDTMLLSLGIFVFSMLCIGLGLTYWEFKHGEPHKEQKEAERMKESLRDAV